MNIREHLYKKEIVICVGSGGVGKTTVAAAIALQAAQDGKKVIVLTIDPAKRLANSLGLSELGNEEKLVQVFPPDADAPNDKEKGSLYAMMLDTKRTFDQLIEKYAPTQAIREKILNNKYYQHVSSALAGSQEYMAMEKLYELYLSGNYQMLVLDTPPTRHALDFLQAPKRMIDVLDEGVLKWFLMPYFVAGRVGFEAFKKSATFFLSIAEKLTGLEILKDLSDFAISFEGMYGGFKERAEKVNELLRDFRTIFLLVTSPNPLIIDDAIFFYEKLKAFQMPFGGFVVNKVHNIYTEDMGMAEYFEQVSKRLSPDEKNILNKLDKNFQDFQLLAERDQMEIKRLKKLAPEYSIFAVPYFDRDIHNRDGLMKVNGSLFDQNV